MKDYNIHLKVNQLHEFPYYIFYLRSPGRQRSSDSTHMQLHTVAVPCPDLDKELHTLMDGPASPKPLTELPSPIKMVTYIL